MYKKLFLPANLRRAREAQGITLEDLAKKLGYTKPSSFSTVGKWETGENTPPLDVLIELANIYNLDINYFFVENAQMQQFNKDNELFISPAERAKEKIKELEETISSVKEEKKAIKAIRINPELEEFIDMIRDWSPEALHDLKTIVFTYETMQNRNRKKRAVGE